MSTAERDAVEASVRARCEAGDYDAAATLAIKGYGAELYGFLVVLHRDDEGASDVFSLVCENVWRGLPKFGWGSTLRTWAYTIARHASLRYRKRAERRGRGAVPMSEQISVLAAQVRTATAPFLKTEHKDAFTRLRETLPEEEQVLLVLRVDRELAWDDLARVLSERKYCDNDTDEVAPDPATLKREAARLRKRFQLVKEKLLALGRREGLVPPEK